MILFIHQEFFRLIPQSWHRQGNKCVMNQGEIIITYRVGFEWCNHRHEQCPKKKMHREREISTRLNQNMASFWRAKSGLCGKQGTTIKIWYRRCRGYRWRYIWCKQSLSTPASGLQQHKRRWRRSLGQPRRPTRFLVNCTIRYFLGKPIAFPGRASKQPLHY